MDEPLPQHELVLLGVGHTNAFIVRRWRMGAMPGVRLTCVSPFPFATYSGMLPGVLSGQYARRRMRIDLVRFCKAAEARLIVGNVTGMDAQRRMLLFDDRPPLRFDVLSVGIGSAPTDGGVEIDPDAPIVRIKPMQTFIERLDAQLCESSNRAMGRLLRVVVIGGGVGGAEVTMCMSAHLRGLLGDRLCELTIVDGGKRLASGTRPWTRWLVRRTLRSHGVRIEQGRRAVRVAADHVELEDGSVIESDVVVWATSAVAPPLLSQLDLPTDERGFLLTRPTLQTIADAPVFAVGDSGSIDGDPVPKAGVHAVRQATVLWRNIARLLEGRPPTRYWAQRNFLKLMNCGDGRAIGEYKWLSFRGRWVWKLKDWVDRKFMRMYHDYRPGMVATTDAAEVVTATSASAAGAKTMRCLGCGGKVGGDVLRRVLGQLETVENEGVLIGLDAPDDAAIIKGGTNRALAMTVDYFVAPLDDAYLAGRIAALHAMNDAWAMGARPFAALASATIPVGPAERQEQCLYELLSGGVRELNEAGVALAGGHTIEGPRLAAGFTLIADQHADPPRTKNRLRVGDALVLTRGLGVGVLLAAHMQARCRGEWFMPMLRAMLQSNQAAARIIDTFDVAAMTDVSGFGLAGHLMEMLDASRLDAELTLDAVTLLPGAKRLLRDGVESSLAEANRAIESRIQATPEQRADPRYAALFDPQTCGGLLVAVRNDQADRLLVCLTEAGYLDARRIGRIEPFSGDRPTIRLG